MKALRKLYFFASLLLIVPFYNFDKQQLIQPIFFKYFTLLVTVVSIILTVCTITFRLYDNYLQIKTEEFLSCLNQIVVLIIYILSSLGSYFWNLTNWKHFMKILLDLDGILYDKQLLERNYKLVKLQVILRLVFFSICILSRSLLFVFFTHNETMIIVHIYYLCIFYFIYYSSILIHGFLLMLKYYYGVLNKILANLKIDTNFIVKIREIEHIYRTISDAVDLFNKLFGLVLLFLIADSLIRVLYALNFCLNVKYTKTDEEPILFVIFHICLTFFVLCSLVILTIRCDSVTSESELMIDSCLKLQQNFRHLSDERLELLNFIQLVELKQPKFTTGGYFQINRSTFLSVLSVASTYILVILQFNGQL